MMSKSPNTVAPDILCILAAVLLAATIGFGIAAAFMSSDGSVLMGFFAAVAFILSFALKNFESIMLRKVLAESRQRR